MTAEAVRTADASAAGTLARLLALLAEEAPLKDFHALLTESALVPSPELADAVRCALSVRALLASRRRRERELSALYETAGDLSSLRDLEAVLQAIVRRARQLLDTDAAYLMLHDETRQLTFMRVTDGIRTDAFKDAELQLGAGLGGLVAATCRPYATADYAVDERLEHRIDEIVAGEGLVAILGVPLRRGTRVIGVLFAANRRQRPFSRDETVLLTSLGDHAAIAIENASLFQEVRVALDELRSANRLVQQNSELLERAAAVHERLNGVMLTGGGLPEIADAVVQVLGGDLAVLDAHGRVVHVVGAAERTTALVEVLVGERGALPGRADDPDDHRTAIRRTVQQDGQATPVTVVPVYAGAEALGSVLLAGRPLDDVEVRILERTAVVTALLLLRERSISEAEQRTRGELIDDLVAMPQRDPEGVQRRAAHLGVDLRTPYVVVVARPADPDRCAAALRAGTLPGSARPGLYAQHAGDLVLLVHDEDASVAAGRLRAQLESAGGCAFTVGAAGPGSGAASVPDLHHDAVRCCEVLLALGRGGDSASADDLGVYGLLLGDASRADVARFVRRTVGPVLDYDRERGTELARTLLVFYACGSNYTRTAAELYVHVNTLYQRLDRVGQLLGDAWRSGDGALQVHLALKAQSALPSRTPEPVRVAVVTTCSRAAVAGVPLGGGHRRERASDPGTRPRTGPGATTAGAAMTATAPARLGALDLTGRRVVVTGGGSGIGAACAVRLGAAGAEVLVLDRQRETAEAVAGEVGGRAVVTDLGDPSAVADLCTAGGPVATADVLVNNAGLQHVAPVEDFPPDRFSLLLRVMLEAPFQLVRCALPHMYEQGWGRVVNISSVHGIRASPQKAAYVAAKHGLEGLSKVIALEGGGRGVTSNTICPGYVRTPLVEGQIAAQAKAYGIDESEVVSKVMLTQPAVKRLIEPAEVAELAAYLCSDAGSFANGSSFVLDGGWSAR